MTAAPQTSDPDDSRAQAIVGAAFTLFIRFGFRRTSMEDIARAAGMSRPALYLHFRNKEDILRHMIQGYFDRCLADVTLALRPGLPAHEALGAFFEAKMGPELETLMASPHVAELWETNMAHCADLVADGEARIAAVLAQWLQSEAEARRVRLVPGDSAMWHARIILSALTGLKDPKLGYAEFRARARSLSVLLARALSP